MANERYRGSADRYETMLEMIRTGSQQAFFIWSIGCDALGGVTRTKAEWIAYMLEHFGKDMRIQEIIEELGELGFIRTGEQGEVVLEKDVTWFFGPLLTPVPKDDTSTD